MMRFLICSVLLLLAFNCKKAEVQKESPTVVVTNQCEHQIEESEARVFVEKFISDLNAENMEQFSGKLKFPCSMFSYSFDSEEQFIESCKNTSEIQDYLSLDIYDENDELVGRSTIDNVDIIFFDLEEDPECQGFQFGLGSGLIFSARKDSQGIKVYNLDVAG